MGWDRKNEPTIHRTFLTLISYVWILHVTVQQAYARFTGPTLGTLLKTPRRLMQTLIISFWRKEITGLDNFRFLYCRRYYERNQ